MVLVVPLLSKIAWGAKDVVVMRCVLKKTIGKNGMLLIVVTEAGVFPIASQYCWYTALLLYWNAKTSSASEGKLSGVMENILVRSSVSLTGIFKIRCVHLVINIQRCGTYY